MDSLTVTDEASKAVAVAPRISKEFIEGQIERQIYVTGDVLVSGGVMARRDNEQCPDVWQQYYEHHTICMLTTRNGFSVIGHSAPMSPENFNEALGRDLAYENAFRQLWPLYAFAALENQDH